MKKNFTIIIVVICFLGGVLLINPSDARVDEIEKVEIKNVAVLEVKSVVTPINIFYSGMVIPDETINYSFRNGGKIDLINVTVGDYIEKGQVIASMNKEDLLVQYQVANQKLKNAILDREKAYDLYNYNKSSYDKSEKLYKSGVISKEQLNGAEITLTNSKLTYTQADKNVESANIDVNYKDSLRSDSEIIAEESGYIVAVNSKVGDRVNVGMPVCTARNEKKIITIGVSQKDLENTQVSKKVKIDINDTISEGVIESISEIPDSFTRTYEVKIAIDNNEILIGSIVDVRIPIGEEEGIWIPIQSILSSSIDYVFIVEDAKAIKTTVDIINVSDVYAQVSGLNNGDDVVINGMRSLKHGVDVKIVDERK